MFAVASVSASDVNDMTIASEDDSAVELSSEEASDVVSVGENEIIGQTENDESISEGDVGNFTELKDSISAVGSGSTLKLTKDYECEDGFDSNGIGINKTLIIDGQGHKIDAKGKSRIFLIMTDNIILKNITFANGNSQNGDSAYGGGAIYFNYTTVVSDCNFTNNAASKGGAIDFRATCLVENCNFIDNSASRGGAVWFENTCELLNCTLTGNYASAQGGAVYFKKNGALINCNFNYNRLSRSSSEGGAVYFTEEGDIENSSFTGNNAHFGGAVYSLSSAVVKECNFTENHAKFNGAGVYFNGIGAVSNSSFLRNNAVNGAGIFFMCTVGEVNTSYFDGNYASNRAGAILSNLEESIADSCIFETSDDSTFKTRILSPNLTVDNLTTVYSSGENLTFDLKTNGSIPISNGNIAISVYDKNNGSLVGTYNCLSGAGWAVDLPVGSYYAIFNTAYEGFRPVNRTIIILPNMRYYANSLQSILPTRLLTSQQNQTFQMILYRVN